MANFDENRFEVSLGRLRSPSGSRRAVGMFERVTRGARRHRIHSGSSGAPRSSVKAMTFHRRVIVKASIKKMAGHGFAAFKKHLNYIQRDGTNEKGNRAEAYGRAVDSFEQEHLDQTPSENGSRQKDAVKAFAESCKPDRHHFRIIISPEDARQLQDLTAYTRDLVTRMEQDLGTQLDWFATNHYDTGQPHTHLILRGKDEHGHDLVIPKKYISYGLRERAQELVHEELGPVSQKEGRIRLAQSVNAKGATALDTSLAQNINEGVIDMGEPVPKGRVWHRQLQVRRLCVLEKLGLAERLGSGRWSLDPSFTQTLRDMNERTQMVKAIHRSLEYDHQARVLITERNRFDPNAPNGTPVTGIVKSFGRADDTREGGFVVVSSLEGQPIYAKVAEDETFESLKTGQIVTFQPHEIGPKKMDDSISEFAKKHDGIYSEALHVTEGGNISQEYARAHVRRLEALRRKKLVTLNRDKTWRIPDDYLARAERYEAEKALRRPAAVSRQSTLTLNQMENARGVTWLDRELSSEGIREFGNRSVQASLLKRRAFLKTLGFEFSKDGRLPSRALESLNERDLRDAAGEIARTTQKPYSELGQSRHVEGVYREAIERPSGKFAVIERARDFTLVPWRPIMERRLGQSILGRVSAGGISWDVSKLRGLSR